MKKLTVFFIVLALTLLLLNNCGYRLSGSVKEIPTYVKSIHIPDFENKTTRFEAEQFITIAVRNEFISRSGLAMKGQDSEADSTLEGEITRFDVRPLSFSQDASANMYTVSIGLNVRFIDLKTNNLIFEGKNISFTETYEIDYGDFFSQETETLIEIADKLASSVVTTILENF
jgi:hypothetical protein